MVECPSSNNDATSYDRFNMTEKVLFPNVAILNRQFPDFHYPEMSFSRSNMATILTSPQRQTIRDTPFGSGRGFGIWDDGIRENDVVRMLSFGINAFRKKT